MNALADAQQAATINYVIAALLPGLLIMSIGVAVARSRKQRGTANALQIQQMQQAERHHREQMAALGHPIESAPVGSETIGDRVNKRHDGDEQRPLNLREMVSDSLHNRTYTRSPQLDK